MLLAQNVTLQLPGIRVVLYYDIITIIMIIQRRYIHVHSEIDHNTILVCNTRQVPGNTRALYGFNT